MEKKRRLNIYARELTIQIDRCQASASSAADPSPQERAAMVTAMTPQGTQLLSHLQKQHSDQFFDDLVPLLEDFTASITGDSPPATLPTFLRD